MLRFCFVFVFFILVVTLTVKQIRVSTAAEFDETVLNGTLWNGTMWTAWNGTAWNGPLDATQQAQHQAALEALNEVIRPRYLEGWEPAFWVTIVMGLLLVLYELAQMTYSPTEYFAYVADPISVKRVWLCDGYLSHL